VAIVQPRPTKTLRKSDPEQVKVFVVRGEQLMAAGDVVAARAVLLRAAESGDPDAAFALAAAYDPNVLARLGVIGIAADVEKARVWYEKARILGSTVAKRRLESLNR
jgi:TPR repeat protein